MVKVKTKVSGCFRSEEGAQEYLTIMSYIGSAREHKINAFTAIREVLNGNPRYHFQLTGFGTDTKNTNFQRCLLDALNKPE